MKTISPSSAVRRILKSDNLIALGSVERFFPKIFPEIVRLRAFCDVVWPEKYCLFVSGSLALSLRSGNTEVAWSEDNHSDVDVWLIVSGEAGVNGLDAETAETLSMLPGYDMVALPWKSPTRISIKIFNIETARRVFSLTNDEFRVLRIKSLKAVKPGDFFYGLMGAYFYFTCEKEVGNRFEMVWKSRIRHHRDLILTDILGASLVGSGIVDYLHVNRMRRRQITKLANELSEHLANAKQGSFCRFFNYFLSRFRVTFCNILKI